MINLLGIVKYRIGVRMKKFVKLLIISLLAVVTGLGLVACNGGGKTEEKGIVCKKLSGDDFYTVISYGAEDGVTSLDISAAAQAKYGENGAKTITVGRIRTGAFDGNTSLKEVIVSDKADDGVDLTIDAGAFRNMRGLEKITLPFVGANANSDAYMNETEPATGDKVKATDKARSIGYIFGEEESDVSSAITLTYGEASGQTATFYIPVALTEITIKAENEINIPMFAFCGLTRITTVNLVGNVKAIGVSAFKNMTGLTKVNIPASVKTIYENAFEGTTALKVFGDNGFKFDAESTLKEIKDAAFKGSKLAAFDISGTQVETIGDYVFAGNKTLSSVKFGTSVKTIGAFLFADCEALTELTYTGTVAQCGEIEINDNWAESSKLERIVCSDGNIDL